MSEKEREENIVEDPKSVQRGRRHFRLAAAFFLFIVIVVSSQSYIVFNQSENVLMNRLQKAGIQSAKQTDIIIEKYTDKYRLLTELLSEDEVIRQTLADPAAQAKILARFDTITKKEPDVMSVYIGTTTKQMIIKPDQTLPAGYDPTTRPWYKQAIEANKLIWTEPYLDASSNILVITVAAPVKGPGGELIGVMALDISLDQLSAKVNELVVGEAGTVVLVGPDFKIMTNKDKELLGLPLNFTEAEQSGDQETKDRIKAATEDAKDVMSAKTELYQGVKAVADAKPDQEVKAFFEYKEDGTKKYASVKKNALGWYILNLFEGSEISEDIAQILTTLITVCAMAAFAALGLAYAFTLVFKDKDI